MFPPNPRDVPVQFVDTQGLTLPPELLNPAYLRDVFVGLPHWLPDLRGELPTNDTPLVPSAVLVGLVMRDAPTVLLTRRAMHLSDHPGQISFPGGRVEPGDEDPYATALREAHEEVGLPPEKVRKLGCLPEYTTGTGFSITPVVGLVDPHFEPRLDASEVAEVFEVPLSFLMTPAHHRRHEVDAFGRRRAFWSMHWHPAQQEGHDGYFIWGATAAMLRNLYRFLVTAAP
jgi:8-oxo-dGTP pyrophosphatase MutT (NUDIX family)